LDEATTAMLELGRTLRRFKANLDPIGWESLLTKNWAGEEDLVELLIDFAELSEDPEYSNPGLVRLLVQYAYNLRTLGYSGYKIGMEEITKKLEAMLKDKPAAGQAEEE
jgi:hypothetical protein